MSAPSAPVSGAVEGIVDEAILRTVMGSSDRSPATIYVQGGKPRLLAKLAGFNAAANHSPWIVLIDLNGDAVCAPEFVQIHMPDPASRMAFRVAVRQAEAWLMGDRERLAAYLRVSHSRIPASPEAEVDAKRAMVNIARHSRDRHVREGMVPTAASGRKTGPTYAGRLIEFTTQQWRPDVASQRVDSLRRCLQHLSAV